MQQGGEAAYHVCLEVCLWCVSLVDAINKLNVGYLAPAVPPSLTRTIATLTTAPLNTLSWPAAVMDEHERGLPVKVPACHL